MTFERINGKTLLDEICEVIFINIEVKNIKINYEKKGEGRTVLILPGWGTTMNVYRNMIDSISTYANIIAFDMPGYGESEAPEEAWDSDAWVDFIVEFIESQGIKELDLIGHSNGGRIIIKMMSRENLSFKVGKIILIGSAGIVHKKPLKIRLKVKKYKLGKKILSMKLVKKLFPNALEKFQKNAGSEDYRNSPPALKQSMVKLLNDDMRDLLPNIKVPTLLLWGENDTATPIEDAELMEKTIPDAGLVRVPGCSHYVFLEQPVYINTIIKTFLTGGK